MLRHLENRTQKESPLCVSTIRRQPLLTIRYMPFAHVSMNVCVCIRLIFLTKLMLSIYKLFSLNKSMS